MRVNDRDLGQIEAGLDIAAVAPPSGAFTPLRYFLLAVSAGVTVWFLTRFLDRRRSA